MYDNDYHLNNCFFDSNCIFGNMRLLQAGRLYCSPATIVEPHIHMENSFELTVATEGRGTVITNNIPTEIKAGDIYVGFSFDTHSIIPDKSAPLKYDFISIIPLNEDILRQTLAVEAMFKSPNLRVVHSAELSQLTASVISEFVGDDINKSTVINLLLQLISYNLVKCFTEIGERLSQKLSSREVLCYKIMHYIDTNIYTLKNLSELTQKFNYNYFYLTNLFKRNTGTTIHDYFLAKKMAVASKMLCDGNFKVSEISEKLNYSSPYAFSKAFKNYIGVSPKEFQIKKRK